MVPNPSAGFFKPLRKLTMVDRHTQHAISIERWWMYQRERFPIFAHGALIAAFSFSSMSFSAQLRGQDQFPGARALLVGFIGALLFFLQLRIADEFKDREDDARFRPYRPVPRGLISLRELNIAGVASAVAQLGLTLWLDLSLVPFLLACWGYLALMGREFFVRDWLRTRPLAYMWSHMLIMPLITLYVTACDWRVAGVGVPDGLVWLLIVSICNGMVMEIGRKIRAPADEEPGVNTYTLLWGRRGAVMAWLSAVLITAAAAWMAAAQIRSTLLVAWVSGIVCVAATALALCFLHRPVPARAKMIEHLSGVWTLILYGSLGVMPLSRQL